MRFWAHALIAEPTYELSRDALMELIAENDDWQSADAYVDAVRGGDTNLVETYLSKARTSFDAGDLDMADRLNQRASAFKRENLPQLDAFAICRAQSEVAQKDGTLNEWYTKIADKYENYWAEVTAVSIDESHAEWQNLPDRKQLAALIAAAVGRTKGEAVQVFEIGCLAGFNLALAQAEIGTLSDRIIYGGLEPNEAAINHGQALYPWIEFVSGTVQDMVEGKLDIPAQIDVCVVSRVFMILPPDDVIRILFWIRSRADQLIICDDIMNVEGEMSVIRTPPDFLIMHPFRRLLNEAGFEIESLEMAAVPDRECTGVITASAKS